MNPRLIAFVAIVAVVICGGVAAGYVLLGGGDSESHLTGTYSYGYTMLDEPIGYLANEDGNLVINFDYWEGSNDDLFTTWNSEMDVLDNDEMADYYWYIGTVRIHTEPGITVTADCIKWTIDEDDAFYMDNPESYGSVTPYFYYNGQILHSTYTTTSVVTDSSGNAQLTFLVLTDGLHHRLNLISDNIEWFLEPAN